jgi:hypothetical protein
MLDVAAEPGGVHSKQARIFERIFNKVEKVGGDIFSYKRRKGSQRTWKDSNENTMYLS